MTPFRLLLIGPTALDYHGKPIKTRKIHLPGLTLQMLAAVVPPDVEVRLVSETAEEIPYHEPWDMVGLTGMGSGIVRAWQIADEFKRRQPSVKVVMGGIAASLAPGEWSLAHCDSLVWGEAEDIFPQVVDDAKAGRLQPVYRMQKRPDVARLPVPRHDLMNPRMMGLWRPVQATRGCPFPCNFCSISSYFEQSYRKRPIDQIVRDVRAAKASGSRYIAFIDDNIGVDFKFCADLFEALIPEKIIWISQCSMQIADRPDMLALAYRSGCRLLSFGVESVNERSLEMADKDFNTPRLYKEKIARIRRFGIEVSTEMILGLEGDDASVFQKTYDFILENRVAVPRFYVVTPVPGTPLYREYEAQERIFDYDFGQYNGGKVVFRPRHMTAQTLQDGYWKLYESLFSPSGIYRRFSPNPARLGWMMRAFLLGVNVHYRGHIKRRITPGIV